MSIYTESFNKVLNELNTESIKKVGKGVWGATKKVGKTIGNRLGKATDTAQNAIVAGVAAPVGTSIANKVQNRKNKKSKAYNSDVATMSAVLSKSESLIQAYMNLEEGRPKGSKNKPKPDTVPKMTSKVNTSKAPKPKISAVQQARNELLAAREATKKQLNPDSIQTKSKRVLSTDPKNVKRRLARAEAKKGTIEKMLDISKEKVARGIEMPRQAKKTTKTIDDYRKTVKSTTAKKPLPKINNLKTKFTKIRKIMNKSAAKHFAAGALATGAVVGLNKLRNRNNKNKEIFK